MLFGQTVTLMTLQQQWSPCLPDNCFGGGGGGRGGIAHSTQVIIIKQKKYHRVSQMITALVEQTVTLFFWLYPQGNLTWDPSGRPSRKPDIVLVEKEKIILLVFKQTGSLSLTALQPGKTGVVVVKAGEWDRWSLPCTAANHDLSHAGLLQLFSRHGLLWLNRDTIAQFCNSSNLCHKNPSWGLPPPVFCCFT